MSELETAQIVGSLLFVALAYLLGFKHGRRS